MIWIWRSQRLRAHDCPYITLDTAFWWCTESNFVGHYLRSILCIGQLQQVCLRGYSLPYGLIPTFVLANKKKKQKGEKVGKL